MTRTPIPTLVDGDTITDGWTLAVETAAEELQADLPDDWTAYNPTIGNGWTIGGAGASQSAAWTRAGKLVFIRIAATFGSGAVFHASNPPTFALPIQAEAGLYQSRNGFHATMQAAGGQAYDGSAELAGTTTLRVLRSVISGTNVQHSSITSTTPFAWAANASIWVAGWYRAL